MPIYREFICKGTNVAFWKIAEPESFFIENTGLISTIKSDVRRIEFMAGRFLLKKMMPTLDLSVIVKNDIGKPYLPNSKCHFSISHSYPYIAVAVNEEMEVGVDIQMYKEKIVGMQSKFLNEKEMALAKNDYQLITLLWSAKEALYKWKASGGQDFSEQLLVNEIIQKEQSLLLKCNIVNEKAPDDRLELSGKLYEEFSFALCV